jgi:hypothetical protein
MSKFKCHFYDSSRTVARAAIDYANTARAHADDALFLALVSMTISVAALILSFVALCR